MRKIPGILIISLLAFISLHAQDPAYTNSSFARISYLTGHLYIQKAADLTYVEGAVNMPVVTGDRIGTEEGRAEIFFDIGTYLRLDQNTKIDILSLPQKDQNIMQLRLWAGNLYLNIRKLDQEKGIELHTADISLYILDAGLYRINIKENTETEVLVFQGMLEAAGESGSVLLKDSQRLEAYQGQYVSQPQDFFAAADDSFDRWSEYRDSQVNKRMARSYLPEELSEYEYELADYGRWDYHLPYGNIWIPGGVAPNWRPYYNGRWLWYAQCGWTWLPYESWGWVTSHYGRWHWNLQLGWYWIPTTVWGPGWVNWYSGHDYWGWTPLSYHGYPGVIINNTYYDRYSNRYIPHNSRALTVIHKNQLQARNISKIALKGTELNQLSKVSLARQKPTALPTKNRMSIQQVEKNRVFLHDQAATSLYKQRQAKGSGVADLTIRPNSVRNIKPTESRNINKKSIGYPSSSRINLRNRSGSSLGRFYNSISGKTGKYSSSRSKKNSASSSSSKRISSGSRISSTRPPTMRSPSRSSSQATSRSGSKSRSTAKSTKTKKKK